MASQRKSKNELHSYQYKWVKNGSIFVRKNGRSKVIKIISESSLDELLRDQNLMKNNVNEENAPRQTNRHPGNSPRGD